MSTESKPPEKPKLPPLVIAGPWSVVDFSYPTAFRKKRRVVDPNDPNDPENKPKRTKRPNGRPKHEGGRRRKVKKIPLIPNSAGLTAYELGDEIAKRIRANFGNQAACQAVGYSYTNFKRHMKSWNDGEPSDIAKMFCPPIVQAMAEREKLSVTVIVESDDPKAHQWLLERRNPDDYAPPAQRLKVSQDLASMENEELVVQITEAILALPEDNEHRRRLWMSLCADYGEPILARPQLTTGEEQ